MSITALLARCGQTEDPFKDFRNFLYYIFTEVFGFDTPGELQYDIADFLQKLPKSPDGIRRGQVQSMRGAGKTYIAITLALWFLYLDPDIKILTLSSIDRKAKDFVATARRIIDAAELLRPLKPKQAKDGEVDKDQKDNLLGFNVGAITKPSKELSLQSYAIFGAFTGCHPDVIISDDIETPENSLTVGKRDKLLSKAYEYESLINPGGYILHLGTPQSEDSVYLKLEKSGYPIRRWPCEAPDLNNQSACTNVSPWLLEKLKAGFIAPGDPTYPERFNRDALIQKLAIYGHTMYALQMLLDTSLADADRYVLKLKNLIVMDLHHEMAPQQVIWGTVDRLDWLEAQGVGKDIHYYGPAYKDDKFLQYTSGVMYIDPKGQGADGVGYAIVKALNGTLYALAVGQVAAGKGNDGSSEAALTKLAKLAFQHGIKKVVIEKNFGDGMYGKLLQPIMAKINGPTEIEQVHSGNNFKEARILDVLQPLTEQHKLVITPQVASNDTLMYQYTRLTRERGSLQHDDMIEALAMACAQLVDLVVIDADKAVAVNEQKQREQTVKEFVKGMQRLDFPGNTPKFGRAPTWSSRATRRWRTRPQRA